MPRSPGAVGSARLLLTSHGSDRTIMLPRSHGRNLGYLPPIPVALDSTLAKRRVGFRVEEGVPELFLKFHTSQRPHPLGK